MKINFLIVVLLFFLFPSYAEAQFQMRYGSSYSDVAKKVIPTQDGNYLVVGKTFGFGSGGNAFIMKVDASGTILWLKDYAGINVDKICDVLELSDKSLAMCGSTSSYGNGNSDGFIMRTDSIGNIIFANAYGSVNIENFVSLATAGNGDEDKGYYVAGFAQDSVLALGTALIKIDSLGNIVWGKWSLNWNSLGPQLGGEDWIPINLTQLASGGVIVIGNINNSLGFDIFKYSSAGNLIWSKRYTPDGVPFGGMYGYSILENSFGEIVINFAYGSYSTIALSWDNFILKLDTAGNYLSSKSYGGLYSDYCSTIANTTNGGLIISGYTNSAGNGDYDAFLIKLDANDSIQWAKTYGTAWSDYVSNAVQTSDGGFILTGQTWSQGFNTDSSKVFLVKTDSLGNSACNDVSWSPVTINQSATSGIPVIPVNFTFQTNPITWNANSRFFYTNNICIPLAINSVNPFEEFWNIAPNPFTSKTTIKFTSEQKNTIIKISNLLGEEINIIFVDDNEVTIEKGEMKSGIYIVQTIDENKNVSIKKMIVQ